MAADRDLLFGLIALQSGLIDQGKLVAAFQAWTLDKSRPIAEQLVSRGDLEPDDRAAVDALVARHLKKHGGDVERSLGAVPVGRTTRERLASLADPDLDATLAHVGREATTTDHDPDRTGSYRVGTNSGEGQRFHILRPHARGGSRPPRPGADRRVEGRNEKAIALAQELAEGSPKAAASRSLLADALRRRARLELDAGDAAGADADARRSVDLFEGLPSRNGREQFAIACARATLSASAAREEAGPLADRAMADLRDALARGNRSTPLDRYEPDLGPLRGRDDFKALMAELGEPAGAARP
ncbi:MAG: hypothetical protein U0800_13600 [Isosphaeraceae bacterium]